MTLRNDVPYVICLREGTPTPWTDNERGVCSRCQLPVVFRPHIPRPSILVCLDCYPSIRDEANGNVEHIVTKQTILELFTYSRRN